MSKPDNSLVEIAEELERLATRIRELSRNDKPVTDRRMEPAPVHADVEGELQSLRSMDRNSAQKALIEMPKEKLNAIFSSLGQMSGKRKPKDWLVAKILFHLFDFAVGHAVKSTPRI